MGVGVCERADVGGRRAAGGRVGAGVGVFRRRSGSGVRVVCEYTGVAVGTGVGCISAWAWAGVWAV